MSIPKIYCIVSGPRQTVEDELVDRYWDIQYTSEATTCELETQLSQKNYCVIFLRAGGCPTVGLTHRGFGYTTTER